MKSYVEIEMAFPHLHEKEGGTGEGICFKVGTKSLLDVLFNQMKDREVQVTWYQNLKDYQYAIGSPVRYQSVELQYVVGKVVSFDTATGMMTLHVLETVADEIMSHGKVVLRALVNKLSTNEMELYNLVCIDILNAQGGIENDRLEESIQGIESSESELVVSDAQSGIGAGDSNLG